MESLLVEVKTNSEANSWTEKKKYKSILEQFNESVQKEQIFKFLEN